jgi:penicillin amidase
MRRRVGLVLKVVALVLAVAIVAGLGYGIFTVRSSFPQLNGTVTLPGLDAEVEVRRDAWGVPQITAETAHDLFMAQGYVHAQDRFWEMDFRRHVTAGRLSELFGADQLETDAFIRTLGWRRVAEQELEILSPETISYLEAYAEGVNAYLAQRSGSALSLEYAVLGLQVSGYQPEAWTPADSVAWLKAMAWDLRSNMEEEILRVLYAARLSDDQVADLFPDYPYGERPVIVPQPGNTGLTRADAPVTARPEIATDALAARLSQLAATTAALPDILGPNGSGIGSNSFAVAGSRTVSGLPILVNDPHLGPSMPGIWTQVGLHCRQRTDVCPFDVSGFSFSGVPGVVIGHNDRIAWGFTNLAPDVADLYLEDVQGDEYRVGNRMLPLEVHEETILVAGGDPVTIRVRSTRHGPLLSDVNDWYAYLGSVSPDRGGGARDGSVAAPDLALRWTALEPGATMDSLFMMNLASDFGEFREAARRFEVPSQNMLYADVDGHIGYQAPGKVPIRSGYDGKWPVPGWSDDYDWTGFVPFEQLPWVLDPADGYIVTANNAVVGPDYPVFLTDDWTLGDRAARLVALLEAAGPLDVEGVRTIDFDQQSPVAAWLGPALLGLDLSDDAPAADAVALLDGWDGQQTADSAPAAFLNAAWNHLQKRAFADELYRNYNEQPDGGDRWMLLVRRLLQEPEDAWWDDVSTVGQVEHRDTILRAAVDDAVAELTALQGGDPTGWQWGRLHTLELRNATFGESGIGPIEWLFNRGPYQVGGGKDTVNATAWNAAFGYQVDWVPSMRMVVDLADLDASRYVNLTGASGHAFDAHYDDQAPLWVHGETIAWPFSAAALEEATHDLLTLVPAD